MGKKIEFKRSGWYKFSKLGRGRKKKQVWRNPNGRDNKMREKKKGKPPVVSVGYKQEKNSRGLLNGKNPVIIDNVSDLLKIKEGDIGIIASVGKKKKLEIARKAKEKNIELYNLNPKKYLKLNEKPVKKAEQKQTKK